MVFSLVMLCLTWAPAGAETLCRKKSGTLKLRAGSVCKKRETVVDPSTFGAVGPTGATGAPGASQLPGPVGGDLAGVYPNLFLRPNVVTTEAFAALPAARAKATVVQAVPNDTPVAVILDDEELDQPGTIFGGNATTFVVPTDGVYALSAQVGWSPDADGARQIDIVRNDASVAVQQVAPVGSGSPTIQHLATVARLAQGDEITLQALQTSGNALNTSASDAGYAYLALHWLGP
jgi:hypothetical protein